MLLLLDEHTATHLLEYEPLGNAQARLAMRANTWKSTAQTDHQNIVTLKRSIASKLVEGGFVFFHYDGDTAWGDRASSNNALQFAGFLDAILSELANHEIYARRQAPLTSAEVDEVRARVVGVTPFYSIESWLYANADWLATHCQSRCGAHLGMIEQWRQEPALLDEVIAPKAVVSCVGSTRNSDLAGGGFPAARLYYDVQKSFAAVVNRACEAPGLSSVLRDTYSVTP